MDESQFSCIFHQGCFDPAFIWSPLSIAFSRRFLIRFVFLYGLFAFPFVHLPALKVRSLIQIKRERSHIAVILCSFPWEIRCKETCAPWRCHFGERPLAECFTVRFLTFRKSGFGEKNAFPLFSYTHRLRMSSLEHLEVMNDRHLDDFQVSNDHVLRHDLSGGNPQVSFGSPGD